MKILDKIIYFCSLGKRTSGNEVDKDNPPKPTVGNDHGTSASILCVQNNIALNNIDIRDPDLDGNVVELAINIWFKQNTGLKRHQSYSGDNASSECTTGIINS